MSQGDYIQYKKRATELKKQSTLPPILTSDQYIGFKQFSAENNSTSTSQTYNELIPQGTVNIFDIARSNTTTCPVFKVDSMTQDRPNRVLNSNSSLFTGAYMNTITQPKYVKFPKKVCVACCTKSSKNNENTDFTECKMNILKNKLCTCIHLQ